MSGFQANLPGTLSLRKVNLYCSSSASILKKYRLTSSRALSPVLEVYRAVELDGALYGEGLWGYSDSSLLTRMENVFLRSLLNLPNSTPMLPLRWDLNIQIVDHIPQLYRMALKELIALVLDKNCSTTWLKAVKEPCLSLHLSEVWEDQANMSRNLGTQNKSLY